MRFSDILASSIHDIKNSLGMIINNLDEVISDPENRISDMRKANLLHYEAARANNNLIQLLSLYKLDNDQLPIHVSEHNMHEFMEELVATNTVVSAAMGIAISFNCDEYLTGYFDEGLVRGVLNSTIGNAQRYAKTQVVISAQQEKGYLVIRIEDDGSGYPAEMTSRQLAGSEPGPGAFKTGRTQLGLFFADQVAKQHRAGDRQGMINLRNCCTLQGGCFELWLP